MSGYFSLYFKDMVHYWEKSGQGLKQKSWRNASWLLKRSVWHLCWNRSYRASVLLFWGMFWEEYPVLVVSTTIKILGKTQMLLGNLPVSRISQVCQKPDDLLWLLVVVGVSWDVLSGTYSPSRWLVGTSIMPIIPETKASLLYAN